jgi:hypothetical protein
LGERFIVRRINCIIFILSFFAENLRKNAVASCLAASFPRGQLMAASRL